MRTFILFLLVVGGGLTVVTEAPAKSYSVESMDIVATAGPDGSIRITEKITYDFSGRFSYAFRRIPIRQGMELHDVKVSEQGRDFALSGGESPGTYTIASTARERTITWYYSAADERRTFEFAYTATGVIDRYADIAEIYFKFVGEDWDRSIGRVSVRVRLPEQVDASNVRAWAHGPLHGTVRIMSGGEIEFQVAPLPARTFWEGRITCPESVFPGVAITRDGDRLNEILAEEARWANEANERREANRRRLEDARLKRESRAALAKKMFPVSILLAVVGLAFWFRFFNRYGRPHPVVSRTARGDMPSDHPPAVLSYLMNRTVSAPAMVATLMDLANRGFLEIREVTVDKKSWFGGSKEEIDYRFDIVAKPLDDLEPFERDLLQFMLNEAGDAKGFSMSAFKKAASKNRSQFRKWFQEWIKTVSEHGKSFGFFEPYPVGAMVANAFCGAGIMAAGTVFMILSEPYAGIAALIGGLVQAVLTAFLSRRTPEGRRLMLGWKGFKKHLKSISRGLGPVTLESDDWSRYLGAAIVFGMHKKLIPKIQIAGEKGAAVYPVWFYAGATGSMAESMEGLSAGFSTMVDTMAASMSSASGAGGGASGGGGGGAGGGGGGAG
jgi:uncharacterized membrane protein